MPTEACNNNQTPFSKFGGLKIADKDFTLTYEFS